MKLHTKLILILIGCLSVVVGGAQLVQYWRVTAQINKLAQFNLELLTEREGNFAKNLYHSISKSVEDSLDRGEMDKFSNLLRQTNQIDGLLEFSLYDTQQKVSYSSENTNMGKILPSAILARIKQGEEMIYDLGDKEITIYHPQKVVPDCIRCHTTWKLDDPHGGVMFFSFFSRGVGQSKKSVSLSDKRVESKVYAGCRTRLAFSVGFFGSGNFCCSSSYGGLTIGPNRSFFRLSLSGGFNG